MNRVLPETSRLPLARGRSSVPRRVTTAVIGGGIAGVAAATILTERGAAVSLIEREPHLGGRAGAWGSSLRSGTKFEMERGLHAFFRHYYNLRNLLRRVDPNLSQLVPLEDYPVLGPNGESQSFGGLPRLPPLQFTSLLWRSPYVRFRELRHVNLVAALEMLAFDMDRSFALYDATTASAYLDSLRLPMQTRRMLFDVFAHSFFNIEAEMSAAELLMMMHFYFSANREGLVFDVPKRPFSTAIWTPFEHWLRGRGATVETSSQAERVTRTRQGWRIEHARGVVEAEFLILALPVAALKELVGASPELRDSPLGDSAAALEPAPPFAVWRLWLDRALAKERAAFAATTGLPMLDSVTIFDRLEDESRRWAEESGGSVLELHAYGVNRNVEAGEIREQLLKDLFDIYPEARRATIIEDRFLLRRDCPAFMPGSYARRPGVATSFANVAVCGDFVKLPFPSALMERAASSGMLAANTLLANVGVRSEPLTTVARRGLLHVPALTG